MNRRIFFRNNSLVVEATNLEDQDGAVVTDADVEATLTLIDGGEIPGATSPVPMLYMGAGKYQGVTPPIGLIEGTEITVNVTATVSGVVGNWSSDFVLKDREFSRPPA